MQLDMFPAPKPVPSAALPTVLSFEDAKSDVQVEIAPYGDGSWGIATHDHYYGYCGHGGPVHGVYNTFEAALLKAIGRLEEGAHSVLVDRSSCCGDSHRRFASKVLTWAAGVRAEYLQVAA
jgi:hypothetical protein